jgi:hypothetical protein
MKLLELNKAELILLITRLKEKLQDKIRLTGILTTKNVALKRFQDFVQHFSLEADPTSANKISVAMTLGTYAFKVHRNGQETDENFLTRVVPQWSKYVEEHDYDAMRYTESTDNLADGKVGDMLLRTILSNPTALYLLRSVMIKDRCTEMIDFVVEAQRFKNIKSVTLRGFLSVELVNRFIRHGSSSQLNLSSGDVTKFMDFWEEDKTSVDVFQGLERIVFNLIVTNNLKTINKTPIGKILRLLLSLDAGAAPNRRTAGKFPVSPMGSAKGSARSSGKSSTHSNTHSGRIMMVKYPPLTPNAHSPMGQQFASNPLL